MPQSHASYTAPSYFQHFVYTSPRAASPYISMPRYDELLEQTGPLPTRFPVEVARHHIIPMGILKAFFRTVFANEHAPTLCGLWRSLPAAIAKYTTDNPFRSRFTTRETDAISELVTQWSEARRPAFETHNESYDDLMTMLLWPPGNLFVGPNTGLRSDDPGDHFESSAITILMGHNVNGARRFNMLHELNQAMKAYTLDQSLMTLDRIRQNIISFYVDQTCVVPLSPTSWERKTASTDMHKNKRRPQNSSVMKYQIRSPSLPIFAWP